MIAFRVPLVLTVIGLPILAGCASNEEVSALRTQVDQAQQTANAAQAEARAANEKAAAAQQSADQANTHISQAYERGMRK